MHRLMHGIPEGHVDIPGAQAFPMDSNLDVMGACRCLCVAVTWSDITKWTLEKAAMLAKN